MTYVGAGMICPHIVNVSTLLGAILSYGILYPLISKNKGDWYPATVKESSMKSLYGYKVLINCSIILFPWWHFPLINSNSSHSLSSVVTISSPSRPSYVSLLSWGMDSTNSSKLLASLLRACIDNLAVRISIIEVRTAGQHKSSTFVLRHFPF